MSTTFTAVAVEPVFTGPEWLALAGVSGRLHRPDPLLMSLRPPGRN
jgi:hypothetical protein